MTVVGSWEEAQGNFLDDNNILDFVRDFDYTGESISQTQWIIYCYCECISLHVSLPSKETP